MLSNIVVFRIKKNHIESKIKLNQDEVLLKEVYSLCINSTQVCILTHYYVLNRFYSMLRSWSPLLLSQISSTVLLKFALINWQIITYKVIYVGLAGLLSIKMQAWAMLFKPRSHSTVTNFLPENLCWLFKMAHISHFKLSCGLVS